jgi:drug/metabolite transporter (DMT)-like permease
VAAVSALRLRGSTSAGIGVPLLFVLLWSTGFVVARYALTAADPLTFLVYRFGIAAVVMLALSLASRAAWPARAADFGHLAVAGLLVNGLYTGGVFVAISDGMEAGTAAILVGLQPLLTVVLAALWLDEVVLRRQWLGFVIGLAGVFLVVRQKVSFDGLGREAVGAVFLALIGISVGTLYQKRFCSRLDLRTGTTIQYGVCLAGYAVLAPIMGSYHVDWNGRALFALAWGSLVLSCGAVALFYHLLRQGAAAGVARLFYLVPPVTAILAFILFDERLGALALAGMVLIVIGVALARPSADVQAVES